MSTSGVIDSAERTFRKVESKSDQDGKSFVETHKNSDMANMLLSMEPYLNTATGKFGYAIARNVRKIKDACAEYLQTRQNLIAELGEEEKDEDGNPTGVIGIKIGTEAFSEFNRRLSEYAGIKHSVDIYKVSYNALPRELTAGDMLALEWMLIDVSLYEGNE